MASKGLVVLSSPPYTQASSSTEYLGLYYVDAYLRKQGIKTIILDGTRLEVEEFADRVSGYDPLLVGITLPTHFLSHQVSLLADALKQRSRAKVVVGGHFLCFRAIEFLEYAPSVDFAVIGEGEITMSELIKALEQEQDGLDVPGIAARTSRGRIISTMRRTAIRELDSLPYPTRPKSVPVFSVASSRGCYMKCGFCSVWQYARRLGGQRWRARGSAGVISEVQNILHQYPQARAVSFVDDVFLGRSSTSRERAIEIADGLSGLARPIAWSVACRSTDTDERLLSRLILGGLRSVHLGIESGSNDVLKRLSKGLSVRENEEAISIIRGLNLSLIPYFIFFEPEMTLSDVSENIEFLADLDLARPSLMRVKVEPYPGTTIYQRYKELGLLNEGDMSYTIVFKNRSVMLLCETFRQIFRPFLSLEQKILQAEFEADIDPRSGRCAKLDTVRKRWKVLSSRTAEAARQLLEEVSRTNNISPTALEEAKKKLLPFSGKGQNSSTF